jgi:hypothetical protein
MRPAKVIATRAAAAPLVGNLSVQLRILVVKLQISPSFEQIIVGARARHEARSAGNERVCVASPQSESDCASASATDRDVQSDGWMTSSTLPSDPG